MRTPIVLLVAIGFLHAQPYTIATVAGGTLPQTPASATRASVSPTGVTADRAGNVYFTSQNAVFAVDSKGVLSHVAGTSRPGFSGDGGSALSAQLNAPHGLAFDRAGNLYVADTDNNRVRRISPDGLITTVAGVDTFGSNSGDGGSAVQAHLHSPTSVAIDASDNLYIGESSSIRKVSRDGIITTLAACPTCGGPVETVLALDPAGNLYVAASAVAWRVSAAGEMSVFAGMSCCIGSYSGEGGPATTAILGRIGGMTVSAQGEVYLTDMVNSRILRIASNGTIHTAFSGLAAPGGLVFDSTGNLCVAELGTWIDTVGVDGNGATGYSLNSRLSGDGRRLRKIAPDGTIATVAGTGAEEYSGDGGPSTTAQLDAPWGVAADASGNIYVSDSGNHTVRKIAPDGVITTVAGTAVRGAGGDGGLATRAQLAQPLGVAADALGNLWIAECLGARVRKVAASGIITTVAGTGVSGYSGDDGPALQAELGCPHAVAVDPTGNLYIADTDNHRLRRVGGDGVISTIAGDGSQGFAGDGGQALKAQLSAPTSLAFDGAGNLYIADTGNNRIRRITRDGTIRTIAGGGQGLLISSNDGIQATTAVLMAPQGLAVDGAGNLYIGETQGNHVRRVSPDGILSTLAGRSLYGLLAY